MSISGNESGATGRLDELAIYRSYRKSHYLSIKVSSYFDAYEDLFSKYRGKQITFVEIGILNGGSLFMWRDYFGAAARIVGVDLNPVARRWEAEGFEIHIGSQSDPAFWDKLFSAIGDVDVVLDDGGHTNEQQIVTSHKCLPRIKDGGMLVVEDVHTSYAREFGNPSSRSFIAYSKSAIDAVNSRFPDLRASANELHKVIWTVAFYQSIVCFHVDRTKARTSFLTSNEGESINAKDFRHHDSAIDRLTELPIFRPLSKKLQRVASYLVMRWQSRKLKEYFF